MNSIAAFQMVEALDQERLRRAEKRRVARELRAQASAPGAQSGSVKWRAIFRFPRYTAAASEG